MSAEFDEAVYPAQMEMSRANVLTPVSGISDYDRQVSRAQDRIAGIIFATNFTISFALGCIYLVFGFLRIEEAALESINGVLMDVTIDTLPSILTATLLSILTLLLLRKFPRVMMHLATVGCSLTVLLLSILIDFILDEIIPLILGAIVGVLLTFYYRSRKLMPKSTALLKLLMSLESKCFKLYAIVVLSVLFSYYYTLFHVLAGSALLDTLNEKGWRWVQILVGVYQGLSILLTIYVVILLTRLIVATVFEQQYLPEDHPLADASLFRILWISIRYKVGSLCYGVFFVGPITTLYWLAQAFFGIGTSSNFLRSWARNCNYYAFNGIIIRDQTFKEASILAWDDVYQYGVEPLANNNNVSSITFYSSMSISIIAGFTCMLTLWIVGRSHNHVSLLSDDFLKAALISLPICGFIFQVVDAGKTAIFPLIARHMVTLDDEQKDFFLVK